MSERDRQFLYTKISNFPDDFKSLNKLYEFYTEIGKFPDDSFVWMRYAIRWICAFSRCLIGKIYIRKMDNQLMQHTLLSQKQQWWKKNQLARKFHDDDVYALLADTPASCIIGQICFRQSHSDPFLALHTPSDQPTTAFWSDTVSGVPIRSCQLQSHPLSQSHRSDAAYSL